MASSSAVRLGPSGVPGDSWHADHDGTPVERKGSPARFAFVCLLVALAVPVLTENGISIQQAEAGTLAHHMKIGVGEHLGGTPVDLIVRDIYPLIAHEGIGKLLKKMLFAVSPAVSGEGSSTRHLLLPRPGPYPNCVSCSGWISRLLVVQLS